MALTAEQIARDVDVMGGLGHASMLTDEGLTRRRAAEVLRAQAAELAELRPIVAAAKDAVDAVRALKAVGCAGDPQWTPGAESDAFVAESTYLERLEALFYPDDMERIYTRNEQ